MASYAPDFQRNQGAAQHGTLNVPWRYCTTGSDKYAPDGFYQYINAVGEKISSETDRRWPCGWISSDGFHNVLYARGSDVLLQRGTAGNWAAPVTIKAGRAQPSAAKLSPGDDVIVAWCDGSDCVCSILAWDDTAYSASPEVVAAAGVDRVGSVQLLGDGAIVVIVEQGGAVKYSLSTDGGSTWGALVTVVPVGHYPVATKYAGSRDLLVVCSAIDTQPPPGQVGDILAYRLQWTGSGYSAEYVSRVYRYGAWAAFSSGLFNGIDAVIERSNGWLYVLTTQTLNYNYPYAPPYGCARNFHRSVDGGSTWYTWGDDYSGDWQVDAEGEWS